jgi:hypothetical protein
VKNLFRFYQHTINHIFKGILSNRRIVRLIQNEDFYPIDLLYNFTFAYISNTNHVYDITNANGIFPEIGAFLAKDGQWQTLLFKLTPLKYNRQYAWIERLLYVYKHSPIYNTKNSTLTILHQIETVITDHIIPYLHSLSKSQPNVRFWKNPRDKMLSHWLLLLERIKNISTK